MTILQKRFPPFPLTMQFSYITHEHNDIHLYYSKTYSTQDDPNSLISMDQNCVTYTLTSILLNFINTIFEANQKRLKKLKVLLHLSTEVV